MSEQFVLLSRRNRSSKLLAVAVVLAVLCTGCGGAFRTELTVDTSQLRADPLFEMAPAGSELIEDTSYSGTSSSFRLRKTWGPVSEEAFRNTLQLATQEREARFVDAICFDSSSEDYSKVTQIVGFVVSADYPLTIRYIMRDDRLTVELGGSNDTAKLDPTRTTQPFEEVLAAAPALKNEGCTEERLEALERVVR